MNSTATTSLSANEYNLSDSMVIRAADGNGLAINGLLEGYRSRLRILASSKLGNKYQRREDASDIVQVTLLEASRDLQGFRGQSQPEFLAWVRQILTRNIYNCVRRHRCEKRNLEKESLVDAGSEHSRGGPIALEANQRRPESDVALAESSNQLYDALQHLSADQRQAVKMRYLEGRSVQQIAEHLNRSQSAAAGLIKRGMKALRAHMADSR